jgi:hypothetical protein
MSFCSTSGTLVVFSSKTWSGITADFLRPKKPLRGLGGLTGGDFSTEGNSKGAALVLERCSEEPDGVTEAFSSLKVGFGGTRVVV